jgi:hypothetical protein
MPLLFGNGPRAVDEIESGFEIREFEHAMQVVFVHHLPARQLGFQGFELRAFQRGDAAFAWNAGLIG